MSRIKMMRVRRHHTMLRDRYWNLANDALRPFDRETFEEYARHHQGRITALTKALNNQR